MGEQCEKKNISVGLLAHVDAGKTTLAEAMLYTSGVLRKAGRVDHQDAFLDNFSIERERGITIFSKQARFTWENTQITLLDTPGHIDFSTEMERTLQVLDYGILVINASDGIQGYTETLWKLLKKYEIPTLIFVNKMDMEGNEKESILTCLQEKLSEGCVDFSREVLKEQETFMENIALCEEGILEEWMKNGHISRDTIVSSIQERKIFPCYFGSALKLDGIDALLDGIEHFTKETVYGSDFSAKVYKIARDEQNNRLTYVKITGGTLRVREVLSNRKKIEEGICAGEFWEEKVNQIRLYSGTKYEIQQEVCAGTICALTGLHYTYPGEGLGAELQDTTPVLDPVLTYQLVFEEEVDLSKAYREIKILEEEDPQLHIFWNEQFKEMHMQLMGEVQIEILKQWIFERFGYRLEFQNGSIVYKETIKNTVEGIGHYEPLRHYAEVHVLLEPLSLGSGMQFATDVSEDLLDKNWQQLIRTHMEEKEHVGVLTGSYITDIKITLIAGKAHLKHTEGGDFRQATYRAIRQGLRKAESVLLEPYYEYTLEIPCECVGRALSDLQRMSATFENPETYGEYTVIKGTSPVATMCDYIREINTYTRGKGRLYCQVKGYEPCHNQQEVVEKIGYDSEADVEHPTGSVFCAHGAGFYVPWDRVNEYMHVESNWEKEKNLSDCSTGAYVSCRSMENDEDALEKIMIREFGEKTRRFDDYGNVYYHQEEKKQKTKPTTEKEWKYKGEKARTKEYLLVDGYNIIFAWEELRELAEENLDAARIKLMDLLCDYQGYKNTILIVVFDAYKVKGNPGSTYKHHNIHVVFTKEAETADMYIEKVTHEIGKKHNVTVATSDGVEQIIIMQQGARRMSANDLKKEIQWVSEQARQRFIDKTNTAVSIKSDIIAKKIKEITKEV